MTETVDVSAVPTFPVDRPSGCPFDPPAAYTELRAEPSLPTVSCPAGIDVRVVSGYDQVRTLLGDSRVSSRAAVSSHIVEDRDVYQEPNPTSMLHLDGPGHSRLRRLLTPEFTVKRMQALREYVRGLIDERIEAMLAKGGPMDLVQEFALPIPSLVICEMLGVPYADRDLFQELSSVLVRTDVPQDEVMATSDQLTSYIAGLVMTRMQTPADDMISRLIQRGKDSAQPLSLEELVSLSATLLIAGHETTANMIGLSTLAFLRNPEQLAALRADPALAEPAVEEMLRYLSVVHLGLLRYVTEDIPYGDETIKAGEWLVAALSAGNRDETMFPNPDQIDIRRNPTAHLTFGFGPHQCMGQQLARVELQEVFSRLYQRIPTLRLAVPFEEISFKNNALVYGVRALPVTWDA